MSCNFFKKPNYEQCPPSHRGGIVLPATILNPDDIYIREMKGKVLLVLN
jgi:hypothetical protein